MAARQTKAVSFLLVGAITLILGAGTISYGQEWQAGKESKGALQAERIPDLQPTLPMVRVHKMAVSPDMPASIYTATPRGLYRSDDSGATWELLPVEDSNKEVFALALHPTDPSTILVGRRDGVWVTHDGGQSWYPLPYPTAGPYIPLSIALAPNQSQVMYMATARDGVYKSRDAGYHWDPINQGLPEARAGGRVAEIRTVVVHPSDANIAYVALERHGVYRTTDGGENWRPFNQGLPSPLWGAGYPPMLAFDPADPNRLYGVFGIRIHSHLVQNWLYVTAGAGQWLPVEVKLPSNVSVLALSVDRVTGVLRLWGPDTVWQVPLAAKVERNLLGP